MNIWDHIAALPKDDIDRLLRSDTKLGQRLRWVLIKTVIAWRHGGKPPTAEQLNGEFDAMKRRSDNR